MTPADDFSHEHDHEPEHSEGDWASGEPPVDDFGDEHAAPEGAATVSETDDAAEDDARQSVVEGKKKFPLLLLAGAVGGLALVGGLAVWHFAGHSGPPPSVLDAAGPDATEAPTPQFSTKPPVTADAAPAPAPDVAPKTAYSAPSALPAADKAAAQTGSAMAAVAPAVVAAAQPAAPAAVAPAPASAPLPVTVVAPAPVVVNPPADDERLTALSNRIDDVQKSLGATVQQLSQISEKLSAQMAAPAADAAIGQRMDRIEQKLTQLEQTRTERPVSHHAAMDDGMSLPAASTGSHHHHHASHVVTHHRAAHAPATKATVAKTGPWVLRAAAPDEAWIAKNATTRELRPVHVGDQLAGVGKVTAIEQSGDGWVVRGSNGAIH